MLFPLCYQCAEEQDHEYECNHADSERQWCGTWTSEELKKAVNVGYRIVKLIEVWHFERSNESPFRSFLKKFIGVKYQCSGFPPHLQTVEERKADLEKINKSHGLNIQYNDVQKNESNRTCAKFILNSFWGRFAIQANMPMSKLINSESELFHILFDTSNEVLDLVPVGDHMLFLNYRKLPNQAIPMSNISVMVGIWTTAMARLELYSHLEKIGNPEHCLLYMDTDSMIFVQRSLDNTIESGTQQGELKDEIAGEYPNSEAYIDEFISSGPKSYAYSTYFPKDNIRRYTCHIKGIPISYKTEKTLNFETMKRILLYKPDDTVTVTKPTHFRRSKIEGNIALQALRKTWGIHFDKRKWNDKQTFQTKHWGFVEK